MVFFNLIPSQVLYRLAIEELFPLLNQKLFILFQKDITMTEFIIVVCKDCKIKQTTL